MRSFFTMGFSQGFSPPAPRLGQDWGNLVPSLITGAAAGYGAYEKEQIAKDQADAAKAAAAAAQANAKAVQAAAAAAQANNPTILGMNQSAVIIGGLVLIGLVGVFAILKSSGSSGTPTK